MLSIVSFTLASNPEYIMWIDVWVNRTTGSVIPGSTDMYADFPSDAYLSDSPRRVSNELDDGRSPYFEIEAFCIIVFTIEYLLRLFCSPQGPGVLTYITTLSNIIDLVSIVPWYLERALTGSNLGVLSVLRLLRLTRITRIFKMSKNFQALIMLLRSLRKSGPALLMLFAFMVRRPPPPPPPRSAEHTTQAHAHAARQLESGAAARAHTRMHARNRRTLSLSHAHTPHMPLSTPSHHQAITGVLFATLIFTAEGGRYDHTRKQYVREDGSASPFESIPASLWWTIVTMT